MRILMLACLLGCCIAAVAQTPATADTAWKHTFRASETKTNNLLHIRLELKPDFVKRYLAGKAWLTLKPHFYATDSLILDARKMEIYKVGLVTANGDIKPLTYDYKDSARLVIRLDKKYTNKDSYKVFVEYRARDNGNAIGDTPSETDNKGLHFVNTGADTKQEATQMWTQGQTEYTSYWAPLIDRPNQRATSEIILTVPGKYVSLSNGTLTTKKENTDGTRTDTWKMEQPHAPFLFFIGAGEYEIVKDKYKNIPVEYYVTKQYVNTAKRIFGRAPAVLGFLSEKLDYEYPWSKYSMMVGHNYGVAGMENTTAALFSDFMLKSERELADENDDEDVIVHEIAHHWFGDLVTPESWSNLGLSEAMATYSEYLWKEHVDGKEKADLHIYKALATYLGDPRNSKRAFIRNFYRNKETLFDNVSYEKGACIMHMLRNYVGDEAFIQSLQLFLKRYSYKSVEATDLRLVFEEVTGKDLNWFWDQWFYAAGHPILDITYGYDNAKKEVTVNVKQLQETGSIFKIPTYIDIYTGSAKQRHEVVLDSKATAFTFPAAQKPDLVNFDPERVVVSGRKENKSLSAYIFQYQHTGVIADKVDAVQMALNEVKEATAGKFLVTVLQEEKTNKKVKEMILKHLKSNGLPDAFIPEMERLAANEKNTRVRALAIDILGGLQQKKYIPVFEQQLLDASYAVSGAALDALLKIDEQKAIAALPKLEKEPKGRLYEAVTKVAVLVKTDADFEPMLAAFTGQTLQEAYNENFSTMFNFVRYLRGIQDIGNFKKGVLAVKAFQVKITPYSTELKGLISDALADLKTSKQLKVNNGDAAGNAYKDQIRFMEKEVGTK